MKTFTKRNYVNNRNKNISDIGRERKKKNIWETVTVKEKICSTI